MINNPSDIEYQNNIIINMTNIEEDTYKIIG